MEWVYNIITPPFKDEFMMDLSEIIINIDVYRAQQQGYGHPLQFFWFIKLRKESKPHGGNLPSRKDKEQYEQHVFIMSFSSLNELTELLLEEFDEEVVNSMIMS